RRSSRCHWFSQTTAPLSTCLRSTVMTHSSMSTVLRLSECSTYQSNALTCLPSLRTNGCTAPEGSHSWSFVGRIAVCPSPSSRPGNPPPNPGEIRTDRHESSLPMRGDLISRCHGCSLHQH